MYKCVRCGGKFQDAYERTNYTDGYTIVEILCKDCIEKIGHENNSDSDSDSDSESEV